MGRRDIGGGGEGQTVQDRLGTGQRREGCSNDWLLLHHLASHSGLKWVKGSMNWGRAKYRAVPSPSELQSASSSESGLFSFKIWSSAGLPSPHL